MIEGSLFAVVATPAEVPGLIERDRWPVHVTVAGNFRVDAGQADTVAAQLVAVATHAFEFQVALGPPARFGAAQNLPVLLAEHPTFHCLHRSLSAVLMRIPGFAAAEPEFWGEGYRPHATLGAAVEVRDGDSLSIERLTLVSLQATTGRRVSTVRLR